MLNSYTEVTISHKIVKQNLKKMAVIQPVLLIFSISVPNLVTIARHLTSFLTCATFKAYTHISVFYFSAISGDIDLKFIQDTYRVVISSTNKFDLHRTKVKVTGTGTLLFEGTVISQKLRHRQFSIFACRHLFVCPIK